MIRWIREFANYRRHENWLEAHFDGNYITARNGSSILTQIVNKLEGVELDSVEFPIRAESEIKAMTRPNSIYGRVVAYREPNKTYDCEVPAKFVTVEVVRKHAQYVRRLRAGK